MSDPFRIKFLIVDDEQSIRKLCMAIGASLGFQCAEAESAEAALALIESEPFEIIVADLILPSMSGVDLLRQVRIEWHGVRLGAPDWGYQSHSIAMSLRSLQAHFAQISDAFTWHVLLELPTGAMGTVEMIVPAQSEWREGFEVYGENGKITKWSQLLPDEAKK